VAIGRLSTNQKPSVLPDDFRALALGFAEKCQANIPQKNKKAGLNECSDRPLNLSRRRPTFPRTYARSIIGPARLNYRVRDGNGCDPRGMTTGKSLEIRNWKIEIRKTNHEFQNFVTTVAGNYKFCVFVQGLQVQTPNPAVEQPVRIHKAFAEAGLKPGTYMCSFSFYRCMTTTTA
jgi:hypothetical protein